MRGFGTFFFMMIVVVGALSVSGVALQKLGATDQMVAEFVQKQGWGKGTAWTAERQAYAFTILDLHRGTASSKLLLIGGVPVKVYQEGSFGLGRLQPKGAQ